MITTNISFLFPAKSCTRSNFHRCTASDSHHWFEFLLVAVRSPAIVYVALLFLLHPALRVQGQSVSPYTLISNIGVLAPGQKIRRIINFRNQFRQPFMVRSVIASCGCTSAKLLTRPDSKIAPGSHVPLCVDIIARVWPGKEDVEVAVVGTAGGSAKVLRYLFQYQVKNLIQFPRGSYNVDLGKITESSLPQWKSLNIERGDNPMPWDQMRCTALDQSIEARLDRPHHGDYQLRLHIARTSSLGIRSCMLRFTFYDRGKKLSYHLDRPVVFRVVGPVDLAPESILFGAVSRGKAITRTLRLFVKTQSQSNPYRIVAIHVTKGSPITGLISSGGQTAQITLKTAGVHASADGHVGVVITNGRRSYIFRENYLALVTGAPRGTHAVSQRK